MIATIHPSHLTGELQAPASKSSMQRACAAALLHKGSTVINNPGHSNDDLATLEVIRQLGADVVQSGKDYMTVHSQGVFPRSSQINCGESGLGLRMFAPLVALHNKPITINGSGSLLTRPMDFFDKVFPLLGIEIQSNKGRLPLRITGPIHPANIEVDGSLSSQFLTGLLMAFAATGASGTSIRVKNLKSRPYIDLTLQVMRHFGWQVEHRDYEEFYFTHPENGISKTIQYTVEGDWSGGALLLVAGAIAGPLTIKGLDLHSTQADKKMLAALKDAGAVVRESAETIDVGPAALKGFRFDATDCPDLFPPLVALASYCSGHTVITGTSRLEHKESNRALTLQEEFKKMGIGIEIEGNAMIVHGGNKVKASVVHSRHDHRIAMACAITALKATGGVIIEEADAVNKSYPDFYSHLMQAGARISYQ